MQDSNLEEDTSDYSQPVRFVVTEDHQGQRLDRFLSECLAEHSRARLQRWVEQGFVTLPDQPNRALRPSTSLKPGDTVEVLAPPPEPEGDWKAEPVEFEVIHDEPSFLVVNKPAGLVVHPAAGHASGTLLNGLLYRHPDLVHLPRAGIVHRLDRDTTGLMVVAKTAEAQTSLVRQLQARTVSREYLALAWGYVKKNQTITGDIGRDPRDRQKMAVVVTNGKPAVTHITILAHGQIHQRPVTLIACKLETGRTHQIRVHLQSIGHPLVGDPTYQRQAPGLGQRLGFDRQALHARALTFDHPTHPNENPSPSFQAPIPQDLAVLIAHAQIHYPH
jgi:23S rRNA pseudouridine1911/1915/1917 synthase